MPFTNYLTTTLLLRCLLLLLTVFPVYVQAQKAGNIAVPPASGNNKTTRVYSTVNDIYDSVFIVGDKVVFHKQINRSAGAFDQYGYSNGPRAGTDNVNTGKINAAPISINISTDPSTCNRTIGKITMQVTGGTPPYFYNINGSPYQSSAVFFVSGPVTYTVGVKDINGVTASASVFVDNMGASPTLFAKMLSNPSSCTGTDGVMELTATGGTPPYTYGFDGANYQTSNIFNNITSGIYEPLVKDALGCTRAYWFLPVDGTGCNFPVGLGYTESTCTNTGNVTFSTGTPGLFYTYSTDGITYQSSGVFSNLASGIHTFYIKNNAGEVKLFSIVIRQFCEVILKAAVTDASCGNADGVITATASAGVAPYKYSIDGINFQSSNTFSGLMPANYTITAMDAIGQVKTLYVVVADDCPGVTASAVDAGCGVANGVITATPVGGVAPFEYSINGGLNYQNSNVFSGLASGTYTITIKDSRSLTGTTQVEVKDRCISVTAVGVNATCGNNNGRITATAANGITPYQYSLDGTTWQNNPVFTALGAGTYTVTVKDGGALTAVSSNIVITNTAGPGITLNTTPANCNGKAGTVTAIASGGTAPLQYSIDGNNFQGSNVFTNVNAGPHAVTVKDANRCTATSPVQVAIDLSTAPILAASPATATCPNDDGTITASVTGGTGPFQYSLNGTSWQQQPVFSKLPSGNYTVSIKDANACIDSRPAIVPFTNTLKVEAGNDATICEGTSVELPVVTNTTGGAITWTPSTGLDHTGMIRPTASPVVTTKYYVTIGVGLCNNKDSVTVFVNPAPIAFAGRDTAVCTGRSVQLAASGGVYYQWSPALYLSNTTSAGPVVTKPAATTTYYLTVTDANDCRSLKADAITVSVTPPAVVYAGRDTTLVANQPLSLQAMDINNSGFTSYTWSPAIGLNNPFIANPIAKPVNSITYKVTAATPEGCEGTGTIAIKVYQAADIYVPNAFSPNRDGRNDLLKAIPIGIKQFKYLVVYNRWGEQVFYANHPSKGWDGMVNGVPQSGTYVWKAAGFDYLGNSIQRKGALTVIR